MEKQNTKTREQKSEIQFDRAPRTNINKEHLGQKLFSSRSWIAYCILQIVASLALIVFVAIDLEAK